MKKLSLFVAPIMAASFLIGCGGGGGDKPEKPNFFVDYSMSINGKDVNVTVDWTPSGNSIELSDFDYTCDYSGNVELKDLDPSGTRPHNLQITFENEITDSIVGSLTFNYKDKTSKSAGTISYPFIIEPYKVTEKQFNDALNFVDVEYLQVLDKGTSGAATDYELSPDCCHSTNKLGDSFIEETYIHKNGVQFDRYYSQREEDDFICIEDVPSSEWLTPQSDDIIASRKISPYDLEYKDFTYDDTEKVYKAHHEGSGNDFTLSFKYSKLMSMVISPNEEYAYTYNETTPSLPTEQNFNELALPTDDPLQTEITVEDNNRVYIEFTNASDYLKTNTKLSIECDLAGEDLSSCDEYTYSEVYGCWGRSRISTINFNSHNDVANSKQYWDCTLDQDLDSDCYITIVLNETFVGPTSGRTIKAEFVAPVDCDLSKGTGSYTFNIDFTDISESA